MTCRFDPPQPRSGAHEVTALELQQGDFQRVGLTLVGLEPARAGEKLDGFYLEAGYDIFAHRDDRGALTPFLRYETLDTQAEVPTGFSRNPAKEADILTFGFAYQPIDQLIFKVDYQDWSDEGDTGVDQWNFAVGYLF